MADLNLMAVVRLSGLSEHLIRAWERRYHAVKPKRGPNGRRLYSVSDLKRLQMLSRLVAQGHAIGTIAQLSEAELDELVQSTRLIGVSGSERGGDSGAGSKSILLLIDSLKSFDVFALDRELRSIRFHSSPRQFALQVARPLLAEVGKQVEFGKLTIAQEHVASSIVRDHLGEIYRSLQNRQSLGRSKKALLCTPENDFHEFGILLSAILLASAGWETQYLGANLPAAEVASSAKALRVDLIVIGTSHARKSERKVSVEKYLASLDTALEKDRLKTVEIWIGGKALEKAWKPKSGRRIRQLASLEDLEQLADLSAL